MINKFRVICTKEYKPTAFDESTTDTRVFDCIETEREAQVLMANMELYGWTVDLYYL